MNLNSLWNVDRHRPLLGSVLIFRKALENKLGSCSQYASSTINIKGTKKLEKPVLELFEEIFRDDDRFTISASKHFSANEVWPPDTTDKWFSTWLGIDEQFRSGIGDSFLQWRNSARIHGDFYVCHLKVYSATAHSDIDAASLDQWHQFFKLYSKSRFILLGDSEYPMDMLDLPNTQLAKNLDLSLNDQLSIIEHSKGFIGSASGFGAAAVLCSKPYTIFKHPDHHPGEFITPSFQVANQNVIRAIDTVANISERFEAWKA